jgi:condensin complex subunit 2
VRKEKKPFAIDFSGSNPVSVKDLFAPGGATKLPQSRKRREHDTYTLPDDMHFTSQLLLRLFLKPKATVSS